MKFDTEIVEIIKRTHDVKSFRFSKSSSFNFKAGQFMFISIPSGNGELKKHFTISSSPTETGFIEFTKKLTGSDYSNALGLLKVGDKVKIDAPYGNFVFDEKIKKMCLLSGGIGITPLRSICKYVIDLKVDIDIILLYGNATIEDIAFKDEFDEFQKENNQFKVIHVLNNPPSGWIGYQGFINADIVKKEVSDYSKRVFYICGPPGMVNAMKKMLKEFELNNNQIKMENFTGY
jgi:ferredoxin-NADP reductase